jgi:hypothetical protein
MVVWYAATRLLHWGAHRGPLAALVARLLRRAPGWGLAYVVLVAAALAVDELAHVLAVALSDPRHALAAAPLPAPPLPLADPDEDGVICAICHDGGSAAAPLGNYCVQCRWHGCHPHCMLAWAHSGAPAGRRCPLCRGPLRTVRPPWWQRLLLYVGAPAAGRRAAARLLAAAACAALSLAGVAAMAALRRRGLVADHPRPPPLAAALPFRRGRSVPIVPALV